MTISYTKLLFAFVLFAPVFMYAQSNSTGYLETEVALGYAVAPTYSHNFSISQRSFLHRNGEYEFTTRQLDITHFSKLKISPRNSIALGLQYRFRDIFNKDEGNEFRITEQFNTTIKHNSVRYGHRLRAEQRLRTDNNAYRFRYRLALDTPLQGAELNDNEFFLVLSTESLLSVAAKRSAVYDQRITSQLGFLTKHQITYSIGAEYRMEDYTHTTQHNWFITANMDISL